MENALLCILYLTTKRLSMQRLFAKNSTGAGAEGWALDNKARLCYNRNVKNPVKTGKTEVLP